jgi:hypothetical protein
MRLSTPFALLVLASSALAVTGPSDSDVDARHRAFLEWEVGTWDATIALPGPDGGEVLLSALQTDRLGACGQWLITDLVMTGEGAPPYEGHGVLGYDPEKERLVGVWVDPQTSWLTVAEGRVSEDGRTLTLAVEGRHPVTRLPREEEWVTTRLADDRRRLEGFVRGEDGERVRFYRIDSVRRADAVPGDAH